MQSICTHKCPTNRSYQIIHLFVVRIVAHCFKRTPLFLFERSYKILINYQKEKISAKTWYLQNYNSLLCLEVSGDIMPLNLQQRDSKASSISQSGFHVICMSKMGWSYFCKIINNYVNHCGGRQKRKQNI